MVRTETAQSFICNYLRRHVGRSCFDHLTHMDGRQVKPLETDVLRIGMGERYDAEYVADSPGNCLLASADRGVGEGTLSIPVQYQGVQTKEPVSPLFQPQLRFTTYWDIQALHPTDETAAVNVNRVYSQVLSGGMLGSPFWTINGFVYPNAELLGVSQGERVQIGYWSLSMMPHPMHLHGHFFKVVNPGLPRSYWIQKETCLKTHDTGRRNRRTC